jgi:leucyl aminopeptidase
VRRLSVWLTPLVDGLGEAPEVVADLVTRGIVEGSYDPATIYRESVESSPPELDEVTLIVDDGVDATAVAAGAERGRIMAEGANLARTLSNRASNDVSPEVLADEARAIAEEHGLWIDVIEPERATDLGMGMFMAIGRGSDNPPRMIVLRSGGANEHDALGRHLAIVGKGVCFDSGGISIKPADRMDEMKMDKTGACTVIAAIATLARLAPGTPLLAVAPAVENMPGPHSARPGDVVRALNGKMVDITNTDAEGRLILGDAMTYAERLGATHIVDVATLTGAVSRALGHLVTGAFGEP